MIILKRRKRTKVNMMLNEITKSITTDFEKALDKALKPYGITSENINEHRDRIKIKHFNPEIKPDQKLYFIERKTVYIDGEYAFTIESRIEKSLLTRGVYGFNVIQDIRREECPESL